MYPFQFFVFKALSFFSFFQVKIKKNQREKKIFYELFADGTLKFSNGETLKVNIVLLIVKSSVFEQLFQNSSPSDIVNIEDFDLTTFKLFLDCLLKFQEFSVEEALLIFPIAWKYETEELVEKCCELLKPTTLNENVCISLNIGLFCKCKKLTDSVLKFLKETRLGFKLLDEELYYLHLEPEAMLEILKILEDFYLDSAILNNVISWGKQYLEKHNNPVTVKEFFIEKEINNFFVFEYFETARSILDFSSTEIGKEFFTVSDLRDYALDYNFDNREINWINIKAGETLTEKFLIENVSLLKKYRTLLSFHRNRMIFFNAPDEEAVAATYDISGKILETQNEVFSENSCKILAKEDPESPESCFVEVNKKPDIISDVEVTIEFNFKYDGRILTSSAKNISPIRGCVDVFENDSQSTDPDEDENGWFIFYEWEVEYRAKSIKL